MLQELIIDEDPLEVFDLEEELAVGAFGTVFRGRALATNDLVAIKVCSLSNEEALGDLLGEISILKRCNHENVVKYFGAYKKDDEMFIAMELCDGGALNTLFEVLERPLKEIQISYVVRETLKGLQYLHKQKIIHRDIKSPNILLTKNGSVKLADFGVSAQLTNEDERRNSFMGTPWWMAPEIIMAGQDLRYTYDYAVDIWALGVVCYEMVELKPPLHDLEPIDVCYEIPYQPAPTFSHPEQWSKEFNDFMASCLERDCRTRPTATQLLKHSFVNHKADGSVLMELIMQTTNAVQEYRNKDTTTSTPGSTDTATGNLGSMSSKFSGSSEEEAPCYSSKVTQSKKTVKTYRPKTLKEQATLQANILSEKLMVQQVRALNNLQKQHMKAQSEMEKKQAVEKMKLEKSHQKQGGVRQKLHLEQEQQLLKKQASDLESLSTQQKKENTDLIEMITHEQAKQSAAIEFDEERMNMERRLIRKNIELQLKQQMLHLEEKHKLEMEHLNAFYHLKKAQLIEGNKTEETDLTQKFEIELKDLKQKNQMAEDQLAQQHSLQAQEQQKQYSIVLKNELRNFKESQKIEMKRELDMVNLQFKDSSIPSKEIKVLKNQQIEKYKQQQEQNELAFQHEQQNKKFRKEKRLQQTQLDQRQIMEEKHVNAAYDLQLYQFEQLSLMRIQHFQQKTKLQEELYRKITELLESQHVAQLKLQKEHHQQLTQLTQLDEDEGVKKEMSLKIEQESHQLQTRYEQKKKQLEIDHEAFMQQSKDEMVAMFNEEKQAKADLIRQKHDKQSEVLQKHKQQIEQFYNAKHQMMLLIQQQQHDQQCRLLTQQFITYLVLKERPMLQDHLLTILKENHQSELEKLNKTIQSEGHAMQNIITTKANNLAAQQQKEKEGVQKQTKLTRSEPASNSQGSLSGDVKRTTGGSQRHAMILKTPLEPTDNDSDGEYAVLID